MKLKHFNDVEYLVALYDIVEYGVVINNTIFFLYKRYDNVTLKLFELNRYKLIG